MPEWITDKTGKFRLRPKYPAQELEKLCCETIWALQLKRHGDKQRVVTPDDLTVLLEDLGAELDLEASFSSEEGWVQGMTEFRPGKSPIVRIRKSLSEMPGYAHRFKSTLAHEAGHILTQKEAYDREDNLIVKEGGRSTYWLLNDRKNACTPNWEEWQADSCMGALLMPLLHIESLIGPPKESCAARPFVRSNRGQQLITQVSAEFGTSVDAACVRLKRLGYLRRDLSPEKSLLLPFPI